MTIVTAYTSEDALEPLRLVGGMLNLHNTLSFPEVVSAQSMLRHGLERVEERISTIEQERDKAREQRDLAIAHDTQPYPTAWAYEQVCRTDREKGEQLATLRAHFTALWEADDPEPLEYADWFAHVEHPAHVAWRKRQELREASRAAYEALRGQATEEENDE